MHASETLRQTPLDAVHRESGAKMVAFGGWQMPVEYSGVIAEHSAVRTAAGLFDVSHMGEFEVEGAGALAFLQRVASNDASRLAVGQAQYSSLPMPNGAPVDDIVLLRRGAERFLLIVNAANVEKDWRWLTAAGPSGCALTNRSDDYALLALQGPRAAQILGPLTAIDIGGIKSYHFAEGTVAGTEVLLSRTGYTGEDGFELMAAPDVAPQLWRKLMEAGRSYGLVPAGLGARDTLRLEAKMCLYGNDIDETTTLVEAGLGWIVSTSDAKGEFPGREILARQKAEGAPRKLVGFELAERGIARHGHGVVLDGELRGQVTSGSYSPTLQKAVGLAYLPTERSAVGAELHVDIRGRQVPARVVATPFYKRQR